MWILTVYWVLFHPSIDILVGRPTRITEVHPMLAAIFWRMISDYPWFPNCDLALTLFMHPCWNIVFFLFSFTRCRWSVIYIWISILIIYFPIQKTEKYSIVLSYGAIYATMSATMAATIMSYRCFVRSQRHWQNVNLKVWPTYRRMYRGRPTYRCLT